MQSYVTNVEITQEYAYLKPRFAQKGIIKEGLNQKKQELVPGSRCRVPEIQAFGNLTNSKISVSVCHPSPHRSSPILKTKGSMLIKPERFSRPMPVGGSECFVSLNN